MLYVSCVLTQEHDVKVTLHDYPSAFQALLQLLQSEYPVIQYNAVVALSLAAENGMHNLHCSCLLVIYEHLPVLLCFLLVSVADVLLCMITSG